MNNLMTEALSSIMEEVGRWLSRKIYIKTVGRYS